MMDRRALHCLIAFLTLGLAAPAQAADCFGPLREPHPLAPFDFESNSRIEPQQVGNYRFGIISCVKNNDSKNSVYVRWLIPGPNGWVPIGERLESTPRLTFDDNVKSFRGCLQYGQRGDMTFGQFLGTEQDQGDIDEETRRGCRAAAGGKPREASAQSLTNMAFKIRNFIPSDAGRPDETMLALDGRVVVNVKGETEYVSVFEYALTPYRNSSGRPSNVSLTPDFRSEALLAAFNRTNRSPVRLDDKGRVEFTVFEVARPVLSYASYVLRDVEGRQVGAISLPVFISGR